MILKVPKSIPCLNFVPDLHYSWQKIDYIYQSVLAYSFREYLVIISFAKVFLPNVLKEEVSLITKKFYIVIGICGFECGSINSCATCVIRRELAT